MIEVFIAFKRSVEDVERFWEGELRDVGEFMWNGFCDNFEIVLWDQAFSFVGVFRG